MKDLFIAYWINQNHNRSFISFRMATDFPGLAEESTYSGKILTLEAQHDHRLMQ